MVLRLLYLTIMQVAIPFFTFAGINFFAFQCLFGWWGLLAPLLFMFGGRPTGARLCCRPAQCWPHCRVSAGASSHHGAAILKARLF